MARHHRRCGEWKLRLPQLPEVRHQHLANSAKILGLQIACRLRKGPISVKNKSPETPMPCIYCDFRNQAGTFQQSLWAYSVIPSPSCLCGFHHHVAQAEALDIAFLLAMRSWIVTRILKIKQNMKNKNTDTIFFIYSNASMEAKALQQSNSSTQQKEWLNLANTKESPVQKATPKRMIVQFSQFPRSGST